MLPVSPGQILVPASRSVSVSSQAAHDPAYGKFSSSVTNVSFAPTRLDIPSLATKTGPSAPPLSPSSPTDCAPATVWAESERFRNLTGVSRLTLNMEFNQAEFIGDATLAQRGVCVPLVAKWLTERELDCPVDFFADLRSEDGREEIMHLAIEAAKRGNGSAIVDYLDAKGFAMEAVEPDHANRVESPGLYSVSIQFDDGGLHNLALHIEDSYYANHVTLFDPNYGELCFGSTQDFHAFVGPYLRHAYAGKVNEDDLSYVQFVRQD